jgi:glucose-6-phosphate 1-dehydrogenase
MNQSSPLDPCTLILFGVTGDLARRKILPALIDLHEAGQLPERFALVGFSRSAGDDAGLRQRLGEGVRKLTPRITAEAWERFAVRLFALGGEVDDPQSFVELGRRLRELDRDQSIGGNRLFYLATPPSAFRPVLDNLAAAGLVEHAAQVRRGGASPWQRVVIEKPFGDDLESARSLNRLVHAVLDESQVYRIDHYLGKETVQNILVFRFGNAIFEPLWNRSHVDHVQITVAEAIGVEGRGEFYEETGVVRDIVQNHLLQMLALFAMEAPAAFTADEVRSQKAQALRSLRGISPWEVPEHAVAGQYEGYLGERGVKPDSRTPTYVAVRGFIDNWRWYGVPFYMRAGKALKRRTTEIAVHFRAVPFSLFGTQGACQLLDRNVLRLRIQPDEGIALRIATKVPGEERRVAPVNLDFSYAKTFAKEAPDAYQRLILDALRGDPTLFAREDEVEQSWRFVDPILQHWAESGNPELEAYPKGSSGPERARKLLSLTGHQWESLGG